MRNKINQYHIKCVLLNSSPTTWAVRCTECIVSWWIDEKGARCPLLSIDSVQSPLYGEQFVHFDASVWS